MKEYKLINFEKSLTRNKKYNAILQNKSNGKLVKIPFGDNRFEQFKDSTGLGLYSNKDHGDLKPKATIQATPSKRPQERLLFTWFYEFLFSLVII